MSSLDKKTQDVGFWRSLDELERDAAVDELVVREFPENADELTDPVSRRGFLQVMGASMAFASVTGCRRWEREEIVPLGRRPEDYVPGEPRHYASAIDLSGWAHAITVSTFDGRPVKVEGNPDHPFSTGASTTFAQGSLLNLYDPDRSAQVQRARGAGTFEDFEIEMGRLMEATRGKGGGGLAILTDGSTSPTMFYLLSNVLGQVMPQARWYDWTPLNLDNIHQGTKQAYGRALRPIAKLDQANIIVALDVDLFKDHPAALRYAADFAKRRNPDDGEMNRLYAIESTFTTSGVLADHRLPLRADLMLPLLMAVDAKLGGGAAPASAFLRDPDIALFVDAMAEDLAENRGRAVLVAGIGQPPAVHALVAKINHTLGAPGATLTYVADIDEGRPTRLEQIQQLTAEMAAGRVETLLILGGNPAYDAPADLDFGAAMGKVKTSIHLSQYLDETSTLASWHVPQAHYLESWGDALTYDGTYTLIQPILEPIWNGKSAIELIALMLGREYVNPDTIVRSTMQLASGKGDDASWRKALHDGFVPGQVLPEINALPAPQVRPAQLTPSQLGGIKAPEGTLEVVFTPSAHTWDGRFANNAWLQETPDFVTKLTWDNAALINPRTAEELGIENDTLIKVRVNDRDLTVVAYTLPGQALSSIAIAVGHGRTHAGRVGGFLAAKVEPKGFDTYSIRTSNALWNASGATVTPTGKSYGYATTQEHWDYRDALGRKGIDQRLDQLVRAGSLLAYTANPNFAREKVHVPVYGGHVEGHGADDGAVIPQLWQQHGYEGHKWGMATDLTKCTGCNACVVACQAENNVPVVGKREVKRSREMHWLRIDRYFRGDVLNPEIAHQPLLCQQCENAPCEQVCPVGATVHSHEGLNDMAYNRCVGTRYCLNNCPYKVRRFNFLDWHKDLDDSRSKLKKLVFNPEVTVRSRGVMEKCTWCVQRIQTAKILAKNDRRPLIDGEIQTACQQACPTTAIVFGDLNDPKSRVSELHSKRRSYALLEELHTLPRNRFLARITNPNPRLVKLEPKAAH